MLLVVSLGSLLLLAASPGTSFAQDHDLVVFDLSTDHTVVTDHTAHFLFNLNTDNITHESVPIGWNSMYKRAGSELSGRIVIDIDAGTVRGELTELWKCDANCDELDGETYAKKMDTGWTATIEAYLDTPGSTGNFAGTVELSYSAAVEYDESPSTCGDQVCYICANRVCVFAETMTGTATVEGLWDGEKLMLSYADRLEADANEMDFDGLRDVQFIMGRASTTMTGIVPATPPPPDEPPPEQAEDAVTDEVAQPAEEATAGQTDAVADPDTPPDAAEATAGDAAGDADDPVAAAPAEDTDKGGISKTALFVGAIILMVLLFGLSFVRQALRIFEKAPGSVEDRDHAASFSPSLLTADPGDSPLIEGALDTPPPPPPSAGAEVTQFKRTPDEIGAGPAYMLQATDGKSYVEGTRGKQVIAYEAGSFVDVIGRAGDSIQVRVGDHPAIWIDKKNLKYLRR